MTELTLVGLTLSDDTVANLTLRDGLISAIGAQVQGEVVDVSGLRALPGLIDLHAHFREPGGEQSEDLATGSRAAVAGGFTTVFVMPNTSPVVDNLGLAEQVRAKATALGLVDLYPVGAVTKGLAGEELSQVLASFSDRLRVFSDDGNCVSNAGLMRQALRISAQTGCIISQHAQDPILAGGGQVNAGQTAIRMGLSEWPNVAESSIVARDVELAAETGGRLHIAHISTAESVEIIRWAKTRGLNVTAEATPHHILLDESRTHGFDTRFKVNPPLRRTEDRDALVAALLDGTIDAIATDHAPHARDSKESEWQAAAFGMIGLQQALAVALSALRDERGPIWPLIERVLARNPARIVRLEDRGELAVGLRADVVLVDASRVSQVDLADNESKAQNNPYLGMTLPDPVVHVFRGGSQVVRDGVIVD